MSNIEEILKRNSYENLKRFILLTNAFTHKELAVFWGAGLSLGGQNSNKWRAPFESMVHDLKNKNINQYHVNEVDKLLRKASIEIDDGKYPEAGCILQKAFELLKESYRNGANSPGFYPNKNFNQFLIDSFSFNYDKVYSAIIEGPYPYEVPALFYIPFIGSRGLTTNIDLSYDKATARLGEKYKLYAIHRSDTPSRIKQIENKDFAIHGLVTEPETLVFTKDQYESIYCGKHEEDGVKPFLRETVNKWTILFLGASLQNDSTVEVINQNFQNNNNNHLIPLSPATFDDLGHPTLTNAPMVEFAEPIAYEIYENHSESSHIEISYILLSLIRESSSNWANCRWCSFGMPVPHTENIIDSEVKNKLEAFIETTDSFSILRLESEIMNFPDCSAIISHLQSHYSIQHHDHGNGWSICIIKDHRFHLEGKEENSVLNNCPLGDTIYVIPSPKDDHDMWKKDADSLAAYLEKWRDNLPELYIKPRIRLIIFPLINISETLENKRTASDNADTLSDSLQADMDMRSLSDTDILKVTDGLISQLSRENIKRLLEALIKLAKDQAHSKDQQVVNIDHIVRDDVISVDPLGKSKKLVQ